MLTTRNAGAVALLAATTLLAVGCGGPPGPGDAAEDADATTPRDVGLDGDATIPRDVGSDGEAGGSRDVAPDVDARADAAPDVAPEASGPGPCDPSCHYDCAGGVACERGGVYVLAFAPRPCCHLSDFAGMSTTQICAPGPAIVTCASSECVAPVDARYARCLISWRRIPPGPLPPPELARLYCAEGQPHREGDACTTDADCSPAAATVTGGLRCDGATARCVAAARAPAPAGFGASCGITSPSVVPAGDGLVAGRTCALCHVAAGAGCVRQACTIACTFDEDCPAGTVCVCGETAGPMFCAGVTDRDSATGRTNWLQCPALDGGTLDGSAPDTGG